MSNENNLDKAMKDVRKAYRLLHDYQRMVLDAVKYIGNQLGMRYQKGVSKFSDAAKPSSNLDSWAWDWLNLVCFEFCFIGPDSVKFSVLLISDTGYFESNNINVNQQYTKTFADSKESQSKLILITSNDGWKFPEMTPEIVKGMLVDKLPDYSVNSGMISSCYDINCLKDMESVNNMLDDFVCKANQAGTKLERITGIGE